MKKIFALLLVCSLMFLTACNQTPPSETTESNSQNQESPDNSLPQGIVKNGSSYLMETPSRVILGTSTPEDYVFYYSKADGKAYVYCFDPLCDHSGGKCFAKPDDVVNIFKFDLRCTFLINNRFYYVASYGHIYSFSFDGSDLKLEYGDKSLTTEDFIKLQMLWSQNYITYDKYIYINLNADEEGNPRSLRFNTETKEMEDLTEKTGNVILPYFFYNGEIYGLNANLRTIWVKADLELKEMTPIEAQPTNNIFYGSLFFETAHEEPMNYNNPKYLGIKATDVATGEVKIYTHEMLGIEDGVYCQILAVDENYVYFYKREEVLVGQRETIWGLENTYKYNDGKLYRVKHDGTECTCIYDPPTEEFEILSRLGNSVVFGDKILIRAGYIGVRDGYATGWDSGWKVGTIGSDGKIKEFENVEFIY